MRRGNRSLMWQKHTYNRRNRTRDKNWRWYCSNYHRGCKASVITTDGEIVLQYSTEHNHEPPTLFSTSDGNYFRI